LEDEIGGIEEDIDNPWIEKLLHVNKHKGLEAITRLCNNITTANSVHLGPVLS